MGLQVCEKIVDGLPLIVPVAESTSHSIVDRDSFVNKANDVTSQDTAAESCVLSCYRKEQGGWQRRQFPQNNCVVRIGSDICKTDISLKDEPGAAELQMLGRLIGQQWIFIETGRESLCMANGIRRRQAILGPGSSCLITLGHTELIFSTLPATGRNVPTTATSDLKYYRLSMTNCEHFFDFTRPVLLGRNPLCDIKVGTEDFVAVISAVGRKLFLYGLSSNVSVSNQDATGKTLALFHGAQIAVGKTLLTASLPEDCRGQGAFTVVPHSQTPHLCLHEVESRVSLNGKKLILPNSGRAIFVGRSPDNYFALDSKSVSRQHAQLIIYDNSALLIDCESTNGTRINGEKIGRRMAHPGDFIKFGEKEFVLGYAD